MASPLQALPQELLDNVTHHLTKNADLAALSQTCRELHGRTIKTVYETITMVWPDEITDLLSQHGRRPPRVDLLLQTLIKHPQYIGAEEVKRAIKDDSVGIMVALVLWHCPNLLDLRLEAALVSQHSFHTRPFWDKLLPVCGETQTHWRKLRHMSIRDNHPGRDLREDVSRSHAVSI
jgi:hypothetical protein